MNALHCVADRLCLSDIILPLSDLGPKRPAGMQTIGGGLPMVKSKSNPMREPETQELLAGRLVNPYNPRDFERDVDSLIADNPNPKYLVSNRSLRYVRSHLTPVFVSRAPHKIVPRRRSDQTGAFGGLALTAIFILVLDVTRSQTSMRCFYPFLLVTGMRRIELYSYLILINDDDDNDGTHPKKEQVPPIWLPSN